MKKVIYIILFACTMIVNAQEFKLSPYTQYLTENPFSISPTFAGIDEDYNRIRLSGVSQWLGIKNAPSTQNLSYDVRFAEKSGGGILLYNDKNGNTKQVGGQLSYAHHLILDDATEQYLSLGISYKFNHFKIETSNFHNGNGETSEVDDPAIGADQSTTNHNFEFGVLYKYEEFFFSMNASNILNKNIEIFGTTEPIKLRNYYIYTGYTFIGENDMEYEPSIYFKYFEGDSRSITDINFKARKYTDDGYMWAGINTRFINDQSFEPLSLALLLGLKKDQYYVGYAFQWNINAASELNTSGTHLITLGFDLEKNRNGSSWSR